MYRDWRGAFYPDGLPQRRWLEHYGSRFDTVEVNNTFYRLPSRDAVAGWADQTPADFRFAVKASRYLTHVKRLRDLDDGYARFAERIEPLRDAGKLGPVLWQLPASFHRDDDRLASVLGGLGDDRHCFEFRHPSWFTEDVYTLLREAGAALVIGDHPKWPFQARVLTTNWTLVRLHWGRRGRRGNYSDREISTWARRIAQWRRRAEVFVYLNNDWEAFAVRNAARLRRSLG
jgi:uncharacterized protein YecE (DUF72 family)